MRARDFASKLLQRRRSRTLSSGARTNAGMIPTFSIQSLRARIKAGWAPRYLSPAAQRPFKLPLLRCRSSSHAGTTWTTLLVPHTHLAAQQVAFQTMQQYLSSVPSRNLSLRPQTPTAPPRDSLCRLVECHCICHRVSSPDELLGVRCPPANHAPRSSAKPCPGR
ncbi:hypothetical protein BKA63DRAFT_202323 [Paraphoma chrysanthemicola]|nr:hypothetical protein BKA63DRAFT_202323 [Paraphoma chrysanthemicola]